MDEASQWCSSKLEISQVSQVQTKEVWRLKTETWVCRLTLPNHSVLYIYTVCISNIRLLYIYLVFLFLHTYVHAKSCVFLVKSLLLRKESLFFNKKSFIFLRKYYFFEKVINTALAFHTLHLCLSLSSFLSSTTPLKTTCHPIIVVNIGLSCMQTIL